MAEHVGDYEWRWEGEETGFALYAPDERAANSALERALPVARLPGVEDPVYAVASSDSFGWTAVSASHAAPDLLSVCERGLLLLADVPAGNLGMPPAGVSDLISRDFGEAASSLPPPTEAWVRRICERGAPAAAEDGLIEEEDLPLLQPAEGDPDSLGRRAIAAGVLEREGGTRVDVAVVADILDIERAETLGLERGMLVLVVRVGAGDLGRLALGAHRDRIAGRIRRGADFGARDDLPAAPTETVEAADLLTAVAASSNFADGLATRVLYALGRSLGDVAGQLSLRAAWRVGGIETREGLLVHRGHLAASEEGGILVSSGSVAAGTGKMWESVPTFGAPEDDGYHPWEEAGLLERWADLNPTESRT